MNIEQIRMAKIHTFKFKGKWNEETGKLDTMKIIKQLRLSSPLALSLPNAPSSIQSSLSSVTFIILLATSFCQAQVPTPNQDCFILKSDILNSTVPATYSIEIPYNLVNRLVGLGIYNLNLLRNRQVNNEYTGWSGPHADKICRAQEGVIPADSLDRSIMPLIPGPHSAFLLDVIIIKSTDNIYCQFRLPSNKLENKDVCNVVLKAVSDAMGQHAVTIDSLEPKNGTNNMYLYQSKMSLEKPDEVLCKRHDSELTTIAKKIQDDIKTITTDLSELDKTLGSHYIDKLNEQSKTCGADSLKNLLLANPDPNLIEECFQLGTEPTDRKRRSPMSVIEIGGGSPKDTEMLREINSNFNKLSRNEKSMFKKLLTIAIEQKLEDTILENQQMTVTQLQEKINGIEHRLNLRTYDNEFLSHISSSVRQTSTLLDKFKHRLGQFISHLSSSLQGSELRCSRMICSYNSDTHLVSRVTGLEVFIKGKSLVAEAGFAPSCRMNLKNRISKYHLQHLDTINATHLRSQDGDEIKIDCLKTYKKCSPDLLRTVHNDDLIAGNVLLSPARTAGFYVQCISPTNLETPSGFTRCNTKRKIVFLPIILDSGERIGAEDIKISAHRSPNTSLQQLAVDLFRTNRKELDEARAIGHHALNHLLKTDKVNSHHISGLYISFTLFGIFGAIFVTYKCLSLIWRTRCCTKKPSEQAQQEPKKESSEKPESKWKAWFSKRKPDEAEVQPSGSQPAGQTTEAGKDPENRKLFIDMGSLLRKEYDQSE